MDTIKETGTPVGKIPASIAPVETVAVSPLNALSAKLEEHGITLRACTEYLRSQAVTDAQEFDDIADDEAAAALTGFSHLVAALKSSRSNIMTETTEETGPPVGKIPAPTAGVILIPPLGIDRVVQLTNGFKAWWSKHGPQTKEAIIDAIAIIAEALKPTPPPAPPAP